MSLFEKCCSSRHYLRLVPCFAGPRRSLKMETIVNTEETVPPFCVEDPILGRFTEAELCQQPTLLFFYPKDDTSGCTKEACAFRDAAAAFRKRGVRILGVNPAASHDAFIAKHALDFPIICDVDKTLCFLFDVWIKKSLYGRAYMGVQRASFLIDIHGVLRWEERNVRVPKHCDRVLAAIDSLQLGGVLCHCK